VIHLAYELQVTEMTGISAASLERVEVFGSDQRPLVSYSGADLDGRVMRPSAERSIRYGRLIRSGTTALIHVWVTLGNNQAVPMSLRHALTFLAEDGTQLAAGDAPIEVLAARPLILGPPFRTGIWFAHNGPGDHRSAHWGSALVNEQGARIPQRYAIDFIGVDETGRAVRGDFQRSSNDDWLGVGSEILAVVDGTVYAARDGIADNQAMVEPPPPASLSADDVYGNYVILAVGNTTFVHYAHLQRNSVAVKAGQLVRRGQLLGRLGNSGNTNGAHLHFNVTNDPSPATAQGVPFVFDAFELLGTTTAGQAVGAEQSSAQPFSPTKRGTALPLGGAVVRFP
jgi:murein DD-endopeptidase MepM/ murein hydrolase activator NlpD